MVKDLKVFVQMRGKSSLRHGILSVLIKGENSCHRISFKKATLKLQSQKWEEKFKKMWEVSRENKDTLTKLEMEAYDPCKACQKFKEIIHSHINESQNSQPLNLHINAEDLSSLTIYIDYFLEEGGFFRNEKLKINHVDHTEETHDLFK